MEKRARAQRKKRKGRREEKRKKDQSNDDGLWFVLQSKIPPWLNGKAKAEVSCSIKVAGSEKMLTVCSNNAASILKVVWRLRSINHLNPKLFQDFSLILF